MRLSREETRAIAFIAAMIVLSILARWTDRPLPISADLAAIDIDSLSRASEAAVPKRSRPKKTTPVADTGGVKKTSRPSAASKPKAPPPSVDLNAATVAELERIPRIGPVLAARIVAYRDSVGRFANVDALVGVKGVGPAMLERLRPYVHIP
ncbi:MAG: helix-hairpin-helix domain-containing protein [Longimicrobiales bacterium]